MTPPTETMEIEEDDFTPLTMEEDLANLAEGLDIGGYYCCDGRECGCNGESKISVLERFIKGYLDKEKEKFQSELSLSQNRILEEIETFINKNEGWDSDPAWETMVVSSKELRNLLRTLSS